MDLVKLVPRRALRADPRRLVRHGLDLVRPHPHGDDDRLRWARRALEFAQRWPLVADRVPPRRDENPLRAFFEARVEGRGIWKWDHYLDAYHRHLARFRGREVHVLEVGVYSGGSLDLWRDYFGPRCHVYGVDVEEACRRYEGDRTRIFVGDQGDRAFWQRFRADVPTLDVVIDDGGHKAAQQAVTLEELLPHLRPGGVYVTEDVHGSANDFAAYVGGLLDALNASDIEEDFEHPDRRSVNPTSGFQGLVDSIHSYPFLTVIEKRQEPVAELVAPKRGSEWAPFLT